MITGSHQVWCTDITYVPMLYGHVYLCCILDWYSRKVLGWQVSNTMDASLCQKALLTAIKQSKALPEILNTDQGSQFTSLEWISSLKQHGITISMDGKGRWRDDVYIERFWRSIKYECIFLKEYSTLPALENGLQRWIKRYNTWRPHQALENKTPQECYREGLCNIAPKILVAPLQVVEASPLRSENRSNLASHTQNLELTSHSTPSTIATQY